MLNEFLNNLKNKQFKYITSTTKKTNDKFSNLESNNINMSENVKNKNTINKVYCNYANGNSLSCYIDNKKSSIILFDIVNFNDNLLNKKLSNFLFNTVVKKWIYIEKKEDFYLVYLNPEKTICLNDLIIKENFYVDYIKSLSIKNNENIEKKKKEKNYAYGLFVNSNLTIDCLYQNQKINLILPELENNNLKVSKKIKDIIFNFVSKKSIILEFINQKEENVFLVNVFNKDNEHLNNLISLELKNNLTENNNNNDDNNEEQIVEEQSLGNLANISVKKDSPFSKKKNIENNEQIVEDQSLGNLANISVKKDSPFSKRKSI